MSYSPVPVVDGSWRKTKQGFKAAIGQNLWVRDSFTYCVVLHAKAHRTLKHSVYNIILAQPILGGRFYVMYEHDRCPEHISYAGQSYINSTPARVI